MRKPKNLKTLERIESGIWRAEDLTTGQIVFFTQVSKRSKTGGRKIRRTRQCITKKLTDARREKARLNVELENEASNGPKLTFAQFLNETYFLHLERTKKPSTIFREKSNITAHFLPAFGPKAIFEITPIECEDLIYKVTENKSKQTFRHLLTNLSNIFKYALRKRLVAANPCEHIERPKIDDRKEPKVLTEAEMQKLLLYLRNNHLVIFYHVALSFFFLCRPGELRALVWADIDLAANEVKIWKTLDPKTGLKFTPKNNESRKVWINPIARQILEELYKETYAGPDSPILPHWREFQSGEQGKPLKIICRALNIPEIRYYDIRATAITMMLARGESLPRVMVSAGHKLLSSTQCYTRLSGVEGRGATNCLSIELPPAQLPEPAKLVTESNFEHLVTPQVPNKEDENG